MNFFCFIYPSYSPTSKPMLLGPHASIDKAMEAGLQRTAGTPEDPVNQGSWDYIDRQIGSTTLRDTLTFDFPCGAPIFTVLHAQSD